MAGFTVFTALGAEAINPSYFRRLKQSEPGTQHVAMGRAVPVLSSDYSYLIVRRAHRVERQGFHIQASTRRYGRTYYVADHRDFVLITINWDTGFVTEISQHATRAEADAALKQRAA